MIVDSNLLIYIQKGTSAKLNEWFATTIPQISAISKIEVLVFRQITPDLIAEYEALLRVLIVHPIDDAIIDQAITLRQSKRMSLGDAIIAATALVHSVPLATANTVDFNGIPGLAVVNPMVP